MILTDRELGTVFWATCGAVVAIPFLLWLSRIVGMGLDEQLAIERRAEDSDPDPDEDPEAEAQAIEEALARDWNKVMADCPIPYSLTAPRAADSPSAADLSTGQR